MSNGLALERQALIDSLIVVNYCSNKKNTKVSNRIYRESEDFIHRRVESEYLLDPEEEGEFEQVFPLVDDTEWGYWDRSGNYIETSEDDYYWHELQEIHSRPQWVKNILFAKKKTVYYLSDEWGGIRDQVLARDNHRCKECRTVARWSSLQVHHITYARFGHERLEDLVTLCEDCHKKTHQGLLTKYKVR